MKNVILKNKTLQYGFVVFAALSSIELWSFQGLSESVYKVLGVAVMLLFIIIVLSHSYIFNRKSLHFKTSVLLFIFIPFLSAVGANIYHGQPYGLSVTLLRTNFFWLFYFVLHIFKIEEKKIIKLLIFIGCVWAFLTIVQQFTYPRVYFFTRGEGDGGGTGEDSSIYRAGVYRFMLTGMVYGSFVLFYYFFKYVNTTSNKKINYIPLIIFMMVGFYYYGTRQYALSMVLGLGMAVLYLKPGPRVRYITIAIPLLLLILGLKNILFAKYIDLTSQQMQYGYEQDVRWLCAKFYLFDYWPHWTAMIIGNGPPHMLSDYGHEYDLILAYFHFYRSDIGILGTFNKYGILYVLNVFWVIFRVMGLKGLKYEDKYLRLFFFNALVLIVLSEGFSNEKGAVFFCFILYLIDHSLEAKKREQAVVQEDVYATPQLGYT